MPNVMIRYTIKSDQVAAELELLRVVYEELESTEPEGLRYATFRLDDEVSFVELAVTDGPGAEASRVGMPPHAARVNPGAARRSRAGT